MFFIIATLADSSALASMRGGQSLEVTLGFGIYVVGIFSVIFLFYTNSFPHQAAQKGIRPLQHPGHGEKAPGPHHRLRNPVYGAHQHRSGHRLGLAFYKLVILLLMKIMQFDLKFGFEFSTQAFLTTAALFAAIFALTLLNPCGRFTLQSPSSCSGRADRRAGAENKGGAGRSGRAVPRRRVLYLHDDDAAAAGLTLFFLAGVLVIIGTYCLFTAGSIAVLKALRKNRRYYYKNQPLYQRFGHDVPHEAKRGGACQHLHPVHYGAGHGFDDRLLYIGMEDAVRRMYPRDIVTEEHLMIDPDGGADESQNIPDIAGRLLSERGLRPEKRAEVHIYGRTMLRSGTDFDYNPRGYTSEFNGAAYNLILLPADDFNALTGGALTLEDDEACVFSGKRIYDGGEISIAGEIPRA